MKIKVKRTAFVPQILEVIHTEEFKKNFVERVRKAWEERTIYDPPVSDFFDHNRIIC